ncbi:condensation domain-containing protein [Streptantibioticus silvisoli]|uniref:Condensation domain-containing protein n=1 Tax=Streptantibioticus silvisoli TaxID=2705255 RepID=A0ABT6W3W5_9ACTN|nr:condensation domain-containing protein [Streptantibioticus silvisoli]MDI5965437.1 condensation domain-containing protein [Streptantibioticus silvisoli]
MSAHPQVDADEAVRDLLAALGEPQVAAHDVLPTGSDADGEMPLSEGQRQLWFLQQLHPDSTTYNVCVGLRTHGPLDTAALGTALTALADRHTVLRTNVVARRGRPHAVIRPAGTPVELRPVGGPGTAPADAEIQRVAREEMAVPFDLAVEPLLRARLLRLAADDHVLLLVWHHLVVDGWSMRIALRDLAALYSQAAGGPTADLPVLPHGYGDFALWQTTLMTRTRRHERAVEHWCRTLHGAPERSAPPPDAATGQQGGRSLHFDLPGPTTAAVASVAVRYDLTPFAVTFTAFLVWLAAAGGSRDVVAGVPSSGRAFPQLDDVVGYFVNLMPLRMDLDPRWSFAGAARAVRAAVADGLDHDLLPFDRIVKALGVPRRAGQRPLAQVMFQLVSAHDVGGSAARWHGLRVDECPIGNDDSPRFDLELDLLHDTDGTLRGSLTVDAARYSAAAADGFRDAYARVLAALCRQPDAPLAAFLPAGAGPDDAPEQDGRR